MDQCQLSFRMISVFSAALSASGISAVAFGLLAVEFRHGISNGALLDRSPTPLGVAGLWCRSRAASAYLPPAATARDDDGGIGGAEGRAGLCGEA